MINIRQQNKEIIAYSVTNIKDLKRMIRQTQSGETSSLSDIVKFLRTKYTGNKDMQIGKDVGATRSTITRFASGIRGTKEKLTKAGKITQKPQKGQKLKSRIYNLAEKKGYVFGGYSKTGQIRVSNYVDIECSKTNGEIQVRMHEELYSHYFLDTNMALHEKDFFQMCTAVMHQTIADICKNSPCEILKIYRRGNKHPAKPEKCKVCGTKLFTIDNKKHIYNVIASSR